MPYSNVRAFHRAQVKIEAVRGTAETTMTRWLSVLQNGGIVATYSRDREDVPETLRSFQGDRDTQILAENCTIAIEARLAYEEIPWWLSCALKGGSATRTGTTTGSTPPGGVQVADWATEIVACSSRLLRKNLYPLRKRLRPT